MTLKQMQLLVRCSFEPSGIFCRWLDACSCRPRNWFCRCRSRKWLGNQSACGSISRRRAPLRGAGNAVVALMIASRSVIGW